MGQEDTEEATTLQVSPDGRYYYFESRQVGGLPGGAAVPGGGAESEGRIAEGNHLQRTLQLYRYDSVQNVVQCISCASPSDPEPKLDSVFDNPLIGSTRDGDPRVTLISGDGSRAFFETPAALTPADVTVKSHHRT